MISAAMADAIVAGGLREQLTLTVLYDERCPLCRRLKAWLARQATLHPVTFVAAASPEARRRFPDLDHARTTRVLTLVSSDGAVYEGERAWLVCGWALPAWQPVTEGLGGRLRVRLVAIATRTAGVYRHRLAEPGTECPG